MNPLADKSTYLKIDGKELGISLPQADLVQEPPLVRALLHSLLKGFLLQYLPKRSAYSLLMGISLGSSMINKLLHSPLEGFLLQFSLMGFTSQSLMMRLLTKLIQLLLIPSQRA